MFRHEAIAYQSKNGKALRYYLAEFLLGLSFSFLSLFLLHLFYLLFLVVIPAVKLLLVSW